MADALGATGRESLAARCFRFAVDARPQASPPSTLLLLRLSLALTDSGQAKEATELLRTAVGRDPEDLITRYVLAQQKLGTGDKKGAKKELRRVADVFPQASELLAQLEAK